MQEQLGQSAGTSPANVQGIGGPSRKLHPAPRTSPHCCWLWPCRSDGGRALAGTSQGQGSRGLKRNLSGPIKWDVIEEEEDPDAQPVDDQDMQGLTEEEVRLQKHWQELSGAELLPRQPLFSHQAGQLLSVEHAICPPACLLLATGADGALPPPCDLSLSVQAPAFTASWYYWQP